MNVYNKIDDIEIKKTFFEYTKSLNNKYIDYFAVGVQNNKTKKSRSIMSNVDWNNEFIRNNYAPNDPVRRVVFNTTRSFIPLDEIDHVDSFGAYIMGQRRKECIKNGIIVVDRKPDVNFLITLGSGYSKFKPIEFLNCYYKDIKEIKKDLILIISKYHDTLEI